MSYFPNLKDSLTPGLDDGYSLGSASKRWKDGYFGPSSLHVTSTAGETGVATDWNWSLNSDGYTEFRNVNDGYLTITRFGNVGIGTTHPTQKLQVDGYVKATPGFIFGDGSIMTSASSGSGTGMSIGGTITSGTTGSLLFVGSASALAQDNSKLFWNDSTFRLGIGTNSPGAIIDAVNNSDSAQSIGVTNTSSGTSARVETYAYDGVGSASLGMLGTNFSSLGGTVLVGKDNYLLMQPRSGGRAVIQTTGSVPLVFANGTAEQMRISSAGVLTFGTAAQLTISSAGDISVAKSATSSISANSDTASVNVIARNSSSGSTFLGFALAGTTNIKADLGNELLIGTSVNKAMLLGTNDLERIRITASGNVSIGSSTATSMFNVGSAAQFQVDSTGFNVTQSANQNGSTRYLQQNTDAGGSSQTEFHATNGSTYTNLFHDGTGFTPSGIFIADMGGVYSNGSGGLAVASGHATAPLIFAAGSAAERARFLATGAFLIGATAQIGAEKLLVKTTDATDDHVVRAQNTSSAGRSSFSARNDASNDMSIEILGSGQAGTYAGLSRANLARVIPSGNINLVVGTAGTGILAFATATAERARIDANGKFLIGATSPIGAELFLVSTTDATDDHVVRARNTSSAGRASFSMRNDASNDMSIEILGSGQAGTYAGVNKANLSRLIPSGSGNLVVGVQSTGILTFSTSSTARATVMATGEVGIGTTTPNELLTVEGRLSLRETTAPSFAANYGKVYTKASDSNLYFKSSANVEYNLSSPAGTGANTSLSNLVSTTINTDLIPAINDGYSLGTSSLRWKDGYFGPDSLHIGTSLSDEGTLSYNTTSNIFKLDTVGDLYLGASSATSVVIGKDGYTTNVRGNLVVDGYTTHTLSETVLINDRYLELNNGYNTVSAKTSGLIVNYLPTSTTTTVNGAYVAGIDTVSNPAVTTTGSATFTAGDIIQISGSTDNNGLFEVLSHSGTILTIRGIGTSSTVEDFSQNQFVTGLSDSAVIRKVNVSIMRSGTDGIWETAKGSVSGLTFTDVGTGTIGGSIANNQVAVGSGTDAISGSAAFTFASGALSILGTGNREVLVTTTSTANVADVVATADTAQVSMNAYGSTVGGSSVLGLPYANLSILFAAGTSALAVGTQNASPVVFGTTNIERMRVQSDGKVGIGTNAPATLFHVRTSNAAQNHVVTISDSVTTGFSNVKVANDTDNLINMGIYGSAVAGSGNAFGLSNANLAFIRTNGASAFGIGTLGANALVFGTGDTERARFNTSGDLKLASTTKLGMGIDPTNLIDVQHDQNGAVIAQFKNGDAGTSAEFDLRLVADNSSDAGVDIEVFGRNFTPTGDLTAPLATQIRTRAQATNGLRLLTGAGPMLFGTVGTERVRILSTGEVGIGTSTPTSTFTVSGSTATIIATKTSNYTLTSGDSKVLVDATSGIVTITLPLASSCSGREYHIKKIDASSNNMVINTTSSDTIDGDSAVVSNVQYRSYTVTSNGTNWFHI